MIYKNVDCSIYKIKREIIKSDLISCLKKDKKGIELVREAKIIAIENSIDEIDEVLNYLLKKTKIIIEKEEEIELPKPNDGEIVRKA